MMPPTHIPERRAEPRDDRTGWERGEVALCKCGHVICVDNLCVYCLHGLPPSFPPPERG